jgi:hypothetical protein
VAENFPFPLFSFLFLFFLIIYNPPQTPKPSRKDRKNLTKYYRMMTNLIGLNPRVALPHRAKIPTPLVSINTGTKDAPVLVQSLDGKTAATDDEIEEAEKKLDEYEQKECAVKQTLYGSISDRWLIEIKNLGTAAEAWTKLCALHENKSKIVAVDKCGQLQNLRMQDGANIQKHLV